MDDHVRRVLSPWLPPIAISAWRALRPRKQHWSERQAALKAEHDRRNVGCDANAIVLRDGLQLKIHPESRFSFEHFCYIDTGMVDELDLFLSRTGARRRLLDVGACHGLFSLVFAANQPSRSALAIDPSPVAFGRLLYNVHKNNAANITPLECALSNEPGTLAMHYDWEHLVAGAADDGVVHVAKERGDTVCSAHRFEPDVIKIDVEGHELEVLQGLRSTIIANKPLIFIELHADWVGQARLSRLAATLQELGYFVADASTDTIAVADLVRLTGIWRLALASSAPAQA